MDRTRFSGRRAAVAVVVLAVLAVGAPLGSAVASVDSGGGAPSIDGEAVSAVEEADDGSLADTAEPATRQAVDADRTRIRVDLRPDGNATWTVELWTRLENDDDRAAFESLEADVENDSAAFTTDFRDRMVGSVEAASEETGRTMAIEELTVSTRTEGVPGSYGVLAYEFAWLNFSRVDGDRIYAGDAIDGLLLEPDTRLTISWPSDYEPTSMRPEPDERTDTAAVWRGSETLFLTGEPRVELDSGSESGSLLPTVALALLGLLLLGTIAWLGRSGRLRVPDALGGGAARRGDGEAGEHAGGAGGGTAGAGARADDSAPDATTASDEAPDAASAPDEATGAAEPPGDATAEGPAADAPPADGAGPATDDEAAAAGESADEEDDSEDLPRELLSNEERVLRVLEDHGGRMKQQQVVAELDWTEAKTSQVVTSMREDDQLEVFRIGRENVLALPEEADL